MSAIRWGILGAGKIIRRWIGGARTAGADIRIIGSRTVESAHKCAEELGIPSFGDYEAVLSDPDIDIVYIAVPHQAHKALALEALRRGKHVLVEKPACVSAAEWDEMVAAARENNRFLMEATWTRCFPAMRELLRIKESGELGALRHIRSYFAMSAGEPDPTDRLFDPAQAGGGLLDVGVYCLHLCDMMFGEYPEDITGYAVIGSLGIDEQAVAISRYAGGALCESAFGLLVTHGVAARIVFEKGAIEIPRFISPQEFKLIRFKGFSQEEETVTFPVPQPQEGRNEGFSYEVAEAERCISEGLLESPLVSHAATARVMKMCDSLRREWGLRYPFE